MVPICGMLTTASTEPRIGFPDESRARTVIALSPARGGSGVLARPICHAPTSCTGTFPGRAPPPMQPASTTVASVTTPEAHHARCCLTQERLTAASPLSERPEAPRAPGPDLPARGRAWPATDPPRGGP